jgi:hypothetical protein
VAASHVAVGGASSAVTAAITVLMTPPVYAWDGTKAGSAAFLLVSAFGGLAAMFGPAITSWAGRLGRQPAQLVPIDRYGSVKPAVGAPAPSPEGGIQPRAGG